MHKIVHSLAFHKPYFTGKEIDYLKEAMQTGNIGGDGIYTTRCENFFSNKYGFTHNLLVTSCTHALEMAALLLEIKEGDEVIMPSYTFVSTANAFMLRGAKIVFADSRSDQPNIDEDKIEELITPKTKAIVVVHYAGVACDMDKLRALANKYSLALVADAAHAIDANYKGKPLGTIADISTFSFHDTKNITCGEGGMINILNETLYQKAEVIREKGTNRRDFLKGNIERYSWLGLGSSYVLSELNSAFLLAQLESLEIIQQKRMSLWQFYYNELQDLHEYIQLPFIPDYATHNAHLFYIVLKDQETRSRLIHHLRQEGIEAVFHYSSLHDTDFFRPFHDGRILMNSDRYSTCLLRLPLYCDLSMEDAQKVTGSIKSFFY